jgi:hypothetical protein
MVIAIVMTYEMGTSGQKAVTTYLRALLVFLTYSKTENPL